MTPATADVDDVVLIFSLVVGTPARSMMLAWFRLFVTSATSDADNAGIYWSGRF